jgi:hypothetical protein
MFTKAVANTFGSVLRHLFVLVMIVVIVAAPVLAQNSYRDATSGFLKEVTFLASGARTTTDATAVPTDVGAYDVGNVIIDITAVSGTSPTLVVNFDVCMDATASKCVLHTATSSLTATGRTLVKVNQFARYVRISYTVGGTTPSFTFSVYGAFKPTT